MEDDNDLQCPVCFEIPQSQIYQCLNGHTVCGKCSASISICPQCRVHLKVNGELIRNRVVESLIARKKESSTLTTKGPPKEIASQNSKSSQSTNTVVWECPVCHKIPPTEIFQCLNGHSICHICNSKVQICPVCKSAFGRSRNHLAEKLLNAMEFPCPWKEQGCNELFPRIQLPQHESFCKFKAMKFCSTFAGLAKCPFQTKLSTVNDMVEIKKVLQHLQTHNLVVTTAIPLDSPYNFSVYPEHLTLQGNRVDYMEPQFLEIVDFAIPTSNLAVLLRKLELDKKGQKVFSFGFVMFTGTDVLGDCPFTVKLFIKGQPKPEIVAKFGTGCVPDLSWSVKPMNDKQYMEFLNKPDVAKPTFDFSLPVSHIQKYYVDMHGCFTFSFTFRRD